MDAYKEIGNYARSCVAGVLSNRIATKILIMSMKMRTKYGAAVTVVSQLAPSVIFVT